MSQIPLFKVVKLLRKTSDNDDYALNATVVSGGAWSFILVGGRKRSGMAGR